MGSENNTFSNLDIFFSLKDETPKKEENNVPCDDEIEEIAESENDTEDCVSAEDENMAEDDINEEETDASEDDESFAQNASDEDNVAFAVDSGVDLSHEDNHKEHEHDPLAKLFRGAEKNEDWTLKTKNESFAKETKEIFGLNFKYWKIIIGATFAVGAICANFACHSQVFYIITKLLKVCGVEALGMDMAKYGNFAFVFCYIVSAVLGGLALFGLQTMAIKLFEAIEFAEGKRITLLVLGALALIFCIGSVICLLAGKGFASYITYRWFGPTLMYLGALLFNGFTKVKTNNDY